MNVKVSIELPERYLEFAEGMVRDGAYGSLSDLVAEHLRELMLARHDDKPTQEQTDAVMALKEGHLTRPVTRPAAKLSRRFLPLRLIPAAIPFRPRLKVRFS